MLAGRGYRSAGVLYMRLGPEDEDFGDHAEQLLCLWVRFLQPLRPGKRHNSPPVDTSYTTCVNCLTLHYANNLKQSISAGLLFSEHLDFKYGINPTILHCTGKTGVKTHRMIGGKSFS